MRGSRGTRQTFKKKKKREKKKEKVESETTAEAFRTRVPGDEGRVEGFKSSSIEEKKGEREAVMQKPDMKTGWGGGGAGLAPRAEVTEDK